MAVILSPWKSFLGEIFLGYNVHPLVASRSFGQRLAVRLPWYCIFESGVGIPFVGQGSCRSQISSVIAMKLPTLRSLLELYSWSRSQAYVQVRFAVCSASCPTPKQRRLQTTSRRRLQIRPGNTCADGPAFQEEILSGTVSVFRVGLK